MSVTTSGILQKTIETSFVSELVHQQGIEQIRLGRWSVGDSCFYSLYWLTTSEDNYEAARDGVFLGTDSTAEKVIAALPSVLQTLKQRPHP